MKTMLRAAFLVAFLSACEFSPKDSADDASSSATSGSSLTFLVINDTYRLDNFPYVRSLRKSLEAQGRDVVLLHAGDFLYPSMLSQRFDGAQMVDVFNYLDGDGGKFDDYFLLTFGNHEFEKDRMKHVPLLRQRIADSGFTWLHTNLVFRNGLDGQPFSEAPPLAMSRMVTVNGIKVGFVSATTKIKPAEYIEKFDNPVTALRDRIRELRAQGARYVVAVTHLTVAEDKALIMALGDDAPDLVAGGHEHDRQKFDVNGRLLVKADADANSAAVVQVTLEDKQPETSVEFVSLPGKYVADPLVQERVDHWVKKFEDQHCREQGAPSDCMRTAIGKTQVDLIAEELTIRRFETNLGDYLADSALAAFRAQGAQVAFLNSGGMRMNYNIPAGPITRTHIDSLFAFPAKLNMIKLSGKQLQQIVNHAITDWTGNGRWLQISGFAFHHDPIKATATQLSLVTPSGLTPVKPDDVILAVTNDFLLNRAGDQDGYTMIGQEMSVTPPNASVDLKALVIKQLLQAGDVGIAPAIDGRICNAASDGPCLLSSTPTR